MHGFKFSVQYAVPATGLPSRQQLQRWARVARQPGSSADITCRLVDETEGKALNLRYRGRDYPTNVLSFSYNDPLTTAFSLPYAGDLVLCVPVICAEAVHRGVALTAHYAHLVIHGMLHLQGFDHEDAEAADEMESLETQLMHKLGFADPYAGER